MKKGQLIESVHACLFLCHSPYFCSAFTFQIKECIDIKYLLIELEQFFYLV